MYLVELEVREHSTLAILSHKCELVTLEDRHSIWLEVIHEGISYLVELSRYQHLSSGILHSHLAVLLKDLGVKVILLDEGVKLIAI